MALLEQWKSIAYNQETDKAQIKRFWERYFLLEKGVYEKLLENPDEAVEGTVKELAEKYNLPKVIKDFISTPVRHGNDRVPGWNQRKPD